MFHRKVFTRFAQQRGEPFYAAWERFDYLANNFLYHDFSNYSLLKFFLNGLDALTRRWVIDGALTTGSPLFCRDDEKMILLLGDMADFDYHRYWDISPQCWSHQYTQDHYPEFIDQPFEFQNDERDSHELITTQLEDTVDRYVALTEAAIENQINSLRNLEEQIENIKKSIFQSRREHEVKRDTQPVIDPVWFDDDDSNNQDSENELDKTENLELFDPSLVNEPQSEEIFEEFSDKGVPTLFFSSHADYSELCVVEVTSLMCLYLARLEGIWNPDPDVVSYDTYFGHQPLFDKDFGGSSRRLEIRRYLGGNPSVLYFSYLFSF
ncbi:uncharacterized protein [Primulina eburnea]|uniref:uncharacterized protein n=1 Tax=Primulina eburnea TaxID=1245227 RepID=UPI003C6BE45B